MTKYWQWRQQELRWLYEVSKPGTLCLREVERRNAGSLQAGWRSNPTPLADLMLAYVNHDGAAK